jgi:hypothetical protein
MIDKNSGLLLGGGPEPTPHAIVQHPVTGKQYAIPRVAVEMITNEIVQGIAGAVAENVTFNVVSNIVRILYTMRCAECSTVRAFHDRDHDFVEPPKQEPAPDAAQPPQES